jgi:hypothetical protein
MCSSAGDTATNQGNRDMKKLDLHTIEMIAIDTQVNDHTSALTRLAAALEENFLVDRLLNLDGKHYAAGEMTQALREERQSYRSWLMAQARVVYENFDEIRAAF